MLGKYLHEHYHVTGCNVNEIRKISRAISTIPQIIFTHDHNPHKNDINIIKTHCSEYKNHNIIFLFRDPRDLLVSLYYHVTQRSRSFDGSISDFIRNDRGGIRSLVKFYNIWGEHLESRELKLIISYEDLSNRTVHTLGSILEFVGVAPVSTELLEEVVDFASFNKMKKMEREQSVDAAWLRTADRSNPNAFKVREGKVGGYRSHLCPEDVDYINNYMRAKLKYFVDYVHE